MRVNLLQKKSVSLVRPFRRTVLLLAGLLAGLSASVSFGASTYQLLLSNAAPYTTAGIITNGSVEGFTQAFVTNAINNINDPYDAGVSVNLEARSLVSTLVFSRWGGTLAAGMSASEVLNPIVNNLYVNGNGSLIANYTNKINLVVSSANPVQGGTIPVSGSTTGIPLGRAVYVTAVPNAAYDFAYWTKVGNITITDTNSAIAEVTATAPGGSFQVNANFKAKRLLTITTVGGTGVVFMSSATVPIVATNKYYFSQGDTVTLSAYGASGDVFKKWSANVADPLSTPTTITMANDTVVTVEFGQAGKQLIVLSSPGGTVSPSGTNQYNLNAAIEISATASNGFAFSGWTKVNGGPVDPAKRLANPASYIMDMDRDFKATFANAYTLTVYQKTPGQAPYVLPPIAAGSYVSYTESNQYVNAGVDTRYAIVGFTGTGDVPATGTDNKFDISSFGQNSSVTWTWQLQYLLRAANTNVALIMVEGWKLSGTTHPVSVDVPDGYKISYWLINGAQLLTNSATIQVLMDGPKQVGIVFASNNVDEDSDGDGLPDWYELQFGLDPNNGNNLDGRFGDPDRDGLDNYTEFRLCATNASVGAKYMDPLNCDTDNDGMDDGYENKYFDVLRQIPTDTSEFISAALLDTTPYGTDDNPDLDTWWSTNTGFQLLDVPLRNIEEYIGPDQQGPTFYNVPASEWATYFPGSTDYPARKKTMKVKLVNASDTGDYSNPANPQTDADGMDDGFEYTWDVWQQNQQGDPIQTKWVKITGTVPAWPGSRYFHPRVAAGTGSDQLLPDYDWLYYTNTAQVRSEFSSYQESIASVFSASNGAFAVNRGSVPWCTNPFLWDTDGDGLSDGWELSFGFNPWVAGNDAIANPDGDAMAIGGGFFHNEFFVTNGFNPNVAWLPTPNPGNWYDNTFEFLGTAVTNTGDYLQAEPHWTRASVAANYGTHPRNVDTDFDGMFDGWEMYLGMDPRLPLDAGGNYDPDALVNWQEFMGRNVLAHWIGRIQAGGTPDALQPAWTNFVASWPNKPLPSNPYDADTDHDQMLDSAEQVAFNYSQGVAGAGGGLNPCSVDTDLDYLPDMWEAYWAGALVTDTNNVTTWAGGMNGTVSDALLDYDGDGLGNYAEYMVGACYQFQWLNNGGDYGPSDPYGTQWDPYDFFDVELSGGGNGDAMTGSGALGAWRWDPAYWADRMALVPYKRFTFLSGAVVLGALNFSTCNPGSTDTDFDGYDDYYEIYHNLNPIRGSMDRVSGKLGGVPEATDLLYLFPYDYSSPFRWGELPLDPVADFDQDGQIDLEEGLTPNLPAVIPYHHTDPSPYFVADTSSDGSWVNKYYKTGWVFGGANYWYWDASILLDIPGQYASAYLFTFEMNEGYDTDNDMVMDGVEIIGDTPGATDPLDDDSPLRQRALYLDGEINSAARLFAPILNPWTSFRGFTIEAWVRPEAVEGNRVIVERSGVIFANNPGYYDASIHRNFQLGITNGIPYIGYDGYGASWVYNVVMSTPNYRLATNRWAHLAGVFDAQNKRLTLYVNGEMAGSRTTQQIPFNGYVAGDLIGFTTPLVIPMNLNVGAADLNPGGVCDGSRGDIKSGWHQWFIPLQNSFPSFTDRFQGWIDEVRCWDGARTQAEINSIRNEKLTRAMVNSINGVTTGDENIYGGMGGNEIIPRLVYAYSFDALPDPRQGIVPQGFGSASYPADWPEIEWWGTFPAANTVYNDRKYVKWISNMASHQPYEPPRDSKCMQWRTPTGYYTTVIPTNIIYFVSPDGTLTPVQPVATTNFAYTTNFPNTCNPYVFEYVHSPFATSESHPQYTSADSGLYGDLLPLGNAQGDDEVEMWDGKSVDVTINLRDQDGDGMPDSWEERYGLNPFDPSDANGDADGDGLTNQQEYQVGGDPFGIYSLDPSQVLKDSEMDSDSDGLANALEASYGTHLILPDTDDDGIKDGAEIGYGMNPTFSLSPAISRVLRLNGDTATWLEGPNDQSRFLMSSFTISAWIKPNVLGGTVLSCETDPGIYNFRLLVKPNGRLAACFTAFDRLTTVSVESPVTAVVPTGVWTHVSATYNLADRKFALQYNGREVASTYSLTRPAVTGYGPTRILVGSGFNGDMDEVAVFSSALAEDRILAAMNGVDLIGVPSLVSFYSFDDGVNGLTTVSGYAGWNRGHVQDFAIANNDWMNNWKNGATLVGSALVVQLDDAPVNINLRDTDGDGLSDGWETSYGLDPTDASGDNGAFGDPDGDLLDNLNELWAGSNPRLRDTDANGVEDGLEDSDLDGLINLDEQDLYGTRPDQDDTDDDAMTDFDEVIGLPSTEVSDPVNAMSPPKRYSAEFNGTSVMEIPDNERFQLSSWTVHAWVNPVDPGTWPSDRMVILRREIENTRFGGVYSGVNFEIGLKRDNGEIRPYARYAGVAVNGSVTYVEVDGTASSEVRGSEQISGFIGAGEWSHILGSYDAVTHKLCLFINGELSTYRLDAFQPSGVGLAEQWLMKGRTTVGGAVASGSVVDGFVGFIDDVAILAGVVDDEGAWTAADKTKPLENSLFASATARQANAIKTQNLAQIPEDAYVAGQVLVRFKDSPTAQQIQTRTAAFNTTLKRSYTLAPVHLLTITDGKTVSQKIAELKANPNVLYAEPNFVRTWSAMPNDPSFATQWGLHNTGQSNGKTDADIDAPEAWDATKGSANMIVAVIDSGVELTHPDLQDNLWVNTGEIPGNGIDDDGNGYIDDVNGYDFINDDNDPDDPAWLSHGTHVAGTIGAVGNNAMGVVGVNWRVKIMACKVGDYWLTEDAILAGIEYAWRMGARVANCSFGGYYYSQAQYDAISAANEAGMLVVAAAGNDGIDNDADPHYPSSFDLPNIIAVAASTRLDEMAYFSNYGLNSVDVAAPGYDIMSTMVGGGYGLMSGTSMASPHVAGLAALVASMYPTMSHLTWKQMVLGSVEKKPAYDGLVLTGGRINARKAVGGGGAPIAYFNFNDGGDTAQDSAWANDWVTGFKHAGVFSSGAGFSGTAYIDSFLDSDYDGLPDWWEIANGLDPYDPAGDQGASGDLDVDGLTNWNEYLAGTNPNLEDSDHDGLSDKNEDSDGDGLSNLEEQQFGTDPGNADTDDDGYADGEERANQTNPTDSWDPELPRAVSFNGEGRLKVNTERSLDQSVDWTVEAWVKPAATEADGIVVRRAEKNAFVTGAGSPSRWIDYELGLDDGIPYIKYAYRDNLGSNLVVVKASSDRAIGTNWTHLAAVRQLDTAELRLFVNGKEMSSVNPGVIPDSLVSGGFETTIGGGSLTGGLVQNGFAGLIDAVRVWPYARLSYEIQENRGVLLPEFVDGVPDSSRAARRLFNFDDGGASFQNDIYPDDWKTGWTHAAVSDGPAGSAVMVLSGFAPSNYDQDDDNITDYTELANGWYERRSDWPFVERYLSFAGSGEVKVSEKVDGEQSRHYALTTWTIEAWVQPQSDVTTRLPLVYRRVLDGNTNGLDRVTFELGLTPNGANGALPRAYVRFNRADSGFEPVELAAGFVPAGTGQTNWTHLAAVCDPETRKLILYVNGVIVGNLANVAAAPYAPAAGELIFGCDGYDGSLKEIRVWNVARTAKQIEDNYLMPILFSTSIQNSFDGGAQSYIGRPTITNDGAYDYDYTFDYYIEDWVLLCGWLTHPFTLETWIKMDSTSAGGIVMERKVESGVAATLYLVCEGLRIEGDGHPSGYIEGWVTEYTPIWVIDTNTNERVLREVDAIDVLHRVELTSELDLRDGKWHHVAFVGDTQNMFMYIDGRLDAKKNTYYGLFTNLGGTTFEGLFDHVGSEGSVLRVAGTLPDDVLAGAADYHPMFDGLLDECMFWNVDIRQELVQQHMTYGLTRPDIQAGLQTIYPIPQYAIDNGQPHHRLVSYLIFDGVQDLPFIRDMIADREPYIIMPRMLGPEIVENTMPPISVDPLRAYDAELRGYFACDDGGFTVENYIYRNDQSYSGQFYGDARFRNFNLKVNPVRDDTDYDGIPDDWETKYDLDPESPMDAYGDLDHDGLGNLHEYLAGTSPIDPMSSDGQVLDFFAVTGSTYRILGEQVTDMDWVDDLWETAYGLNPEMFDSKGEGSDSDGDGWSNLSEFQELVHWISVAGTNAVPGGVTTVIEEEHALSDSAEYTLIEEALRAENLKDFADGVQYLQRWNDPTDPLRHPVPEMIFKINYVGLNRWMPDAEFVIMAYSSRTMDIPDAVIKGTADRSASYPAFVTLNLASTNNVTIEGNVREGQNWFWGFMDLNGDGLYQADTEPAGMSEPINVGWGSVGPIDMPLTDRAPMGFGRCSWAADPLATKYHVYIVDKNAPNAPTILYQTYSPFRTFLHEGDILKVKKLKKGLSRTGGFAWYVRAEYGNTQKDTASGMFYATYANPVAAPKLLWPTGKARLRHSLDVFRWKMDASVTMCSIVVRKNTGEIVLSKKFVPPFRNAFGAYEMAMPIYIGDGVISDGVYTYELTVFNPYSSAMSSSKFTVKKADYPGYAYTLSGSLVYPGKVTNGNFIVEAFTSPGFGGIPAGRVIVPNSVTAAKWPLNVIPFSIPGLPKDTYYIRAYLDQNGKYPAYTCETFESVGWLAEYFYWPKGVDMNESMSFPQWVKVLPADTDNDKLPDDWEYMWNKELESFGPGDLYEYTPSLSYPLNVFQCYGYSQLGLNPK